MEMTEAYEWRGRTVVDRDGDKIGKLEEVYLDVVTEAPEWALVESGLLAKKRYLVPLRDASPVGEDVRVPIEKSRVESAPTVDADPELYQDDEERLYHHYGFEYSEARSESGLPEEPGRPAAAETTEPEDAVTRSEEELTGPRTAGSAKSARSVRSHRPRSLLSLRSPASFASTSRRRASTSAPRKSK